MSTLGYLPKFWASKKAVVVLTEWGARFQISVQPLPWSTPTPAPALNHVGHRIAIRKTAINFDDFLGPVHQARTVAPEGAYWAKEWRSGGPGVFDPVNADIQRIAGPLNEPGVKSFDRSFIPRANSGAPGIGTKWNETAVLKVCK